jgi:hypothetical protein
LRRLRESGGNVSPVRKLDAIRANGARRGSYAPNLEGAQVFVVPEVDRDANKASPSLKRVARLHRFGCSGWVR